MCSKMTDAHCTSTHKHPRLVVFTHHSEEHQSPSYGQNLSVDRHVSTEGLA
jgi:hypothetical protein